MSEHFTLTAPYQPVGDQPQAIEKLTQGLQAGVKDQVLMGVTGSGKTFTMANVIARANRPVLVLSHNKTLAAQLFGEFREFFPHNAVEYFVSYYDYYQPEAYIPQKDIYIEKDSSVNEEIDRLRLAATSSLLSRRDTIIVASVSAIYGLGSPSEYAHHTIDIEVGMQLSRDAMIARLIEMQYARNDIEFTRGKVRVRGDVVELCPSYGQNALRVSFFGDEVEQILEFDPVGGGLLAKLKKVKIFPAKHYVVSEDRLEQAIKDIKQELIDRVHYFNANGKLLESQRLQARTAYDLEMIAEVGYCSGIENYSRHLEGRAPGTRPYCLLDYFPKDFLLVIDESHATVPQIRGMYNGDRARKETLVTHGFRLPSALDNRPMTFEEFERASGQTVYISATPGPYELQRTGGEVVEQIIRPTGLVDPRIRVEPAVNQVKDLIGEIKKRIEVKERVLVTTLTKRMAEDLTHFLNADGVRVQYLHSDVETLERVEILKALRSGEHDVLVGVNLLREGLDLPEVSLVAILDADKEGFLRSATSLIQTIGRTARNVNAEVILYADKITPAMKQAIDETNRRRDIQMRYNTEHGITPQTIKKAIRPGIEDILKAHKVEQEALGVADAKWNKMELIRQLEAEMLEAAEQLEFERAAYLRDKLEELENEGRALVNRGKGRKKKSYFR